MPLVQSLDILRQRVANPTFKGVLDSVHDKVKAGSALSDAFAGHGVDVPGRLFGLAGGGGAERRPGGGPPALRDLRQGHHVRPEEDPVGADLSGDPHRHDARPGGHHRPAGGAGLFDVLRQLRPRAAAVHPHHRRHLQLPGRQLLDDSGRRRAGRHRAWRRGCDGPASGPVSTGSCCACRGSARPPASSRRLKRRGRLPRCSGAASRSSRRWRSRPARCRTASWRARSIIVRQRVQEGAGFASALAARGVFPDVAVKMVEVGESTGALQEMLNSLAEFYDEEIETEVGRFITVIEPAPAHRHGHHHRRCGPGALHAALRAELGGRRLDGLKG